MKRILILIVSTVVLLLILFAIYIGNLNPQIKYEVSNGYSGYQSILILNRDGEYSLEITSHRGQPAKQFIGRLSLEEVKEIKESLILNVFVILDEDLSEHSLLDNSTEKLSIRLGIFSRESGGYGVSNQRFRRIVNELELLIASHN